MESVDYCAAIPPKSLPQQLPPGIFMMKLLSSITLQPIAGVVTERVPPAIKITVIIPIVQFMEERLPIQRQSMSVCMNLGTALEIYAMSTLLLQKVIPIVPV